MKQGGISVKNCLTDKTLAYSFTKTLQDSKFNLLRRGIMGYEDVAMLWNDSNIEGTESRTYKECVEDMGIIVDVDDGHTYEQTWYDVFSRCTNGGGNVRPQV